MIFSSTYLATTSDERRGSVTMT